jgi:hypothetical protein
MKIRVDSGLGLCFYRLTVNYQNMARLSRKICQKLTIFLVSEPAEKQGGNILWEG